MLPKMRIWRQHGWQQRGSYDDNYYFRGEFAITIGDNTSTHARHASIPNYFNSVDLNWGLPRGVLFSLAVMSLGFDKGPGWTDFSEGTVERDIWAWVLSLLDPKKYKFSTVSS